MNKKLLIYSLYIVTAIFIILDLVFSFSQVTDNDIKVPNIDKTFCELSPRPIRVSWFGDVSSLSCSWPWYRSFVRVTYLFASLFSLNGLFFSIKKNKNLYFMCFVCSLLIFGIFGLYSFIADSKLISSSYDICLDALNKEISSIKFECTYRRYFATAAFNGLSTLMFIVVSILSILNRTILMDVKNNNNNNNSNNNNSNNKPKNTSNNTATSNNNNNDKSNKGFFKLEEDNYPNYSLSSTQSI